MTTKLTLKEIVESIKEKPDWNTLKDRQETCYMISIRTDDQAGVQREATLSDRRILQLGSKPVRYDSFMNLLVFENYLIVYDPESVQRLYYFGEDSYENHELLSKLMKESNLK